MKQFLLFAFVSLAAIYSNAQVTVYLKLTNYPQNQNMLVDENPGTPHSGQILLTTVSNKEVQTLNIGSQSSGAGAGRVDFDSIVFTKPVSVNTPALFLMMCIGTPFQFAEFSYYNTADQIIFRQTMSLVAVKSMQRTAASCASGCPGIIENISFEYGSEVFTFYTTPGNLSTGVSRGWNRVTNTRQDNPAIPIN